jgi:hypothetical protein
LDPSHFGQPAWTVSSGPTTHHEKSALTPMEAERVPFQPDHEKEPASF